MFGSLLVKLWLSQWPPVVDFCLFWSITTNRQWNTHIWAQIIDPLGKTFVSIYGLYCISPKVQEWQPTARHADDPKYHVNERHSWHGQNYLCYYTGDCSPYLEEHLKLSRVSLGHYWWSYDHKNDPFRPKMSILDISTKLALNNHIWAQILDPLGKAVIFI